MAKWPLCRRACPARSMLRLNSALRGPAGIVIELNNGESFARPGKCRRALGRLRLLYIRKREFVSLSYSGALFSVEASMHGRRRGGAGCINVKAANDHFSFSVYTFDDMLVEVISTALRRCRNFNRCEHL